MHQAPGVKFKTMHPYYEPHQHSIDSTWVKYCPRCGGKLEERFIEFEQRVRKVCSQCGFIFYLNPKVVAAAVPRQEGRIWLLRRNIEPGLGRWTFPGGYVDLGERVPDAAVRETRDVRLPVTRFIGDVSEPVSIGRNAVTELIPWQPDDRPSGLWRFEGKRPNVLLGCRVDMNETQHPAVR